MCKEKVIFAGVMVSKILILFLHKVIYMPTITNTKIPVIRKFQAVSAKINTSSLDLAVLTVSPIGTLLCHAREINLRSTCKEQGNLDGCRQGSFFRGRKLKIKIRSPLGWSCAEAYGLVCLRTVTLQIPRKVFGSSVRT
jgi:hypothetical protein